jgi:8-amino-7-oxononanoate synthase
MSLPWDLEPALAERRRQQRYRQRATVDSPSGATVTVDGRACRNFCSNDYLGLANHPDVVAALRAGAEHYGAGSGASHLVCGHQRPHQELEEALADFTGRERALLFSTGYMANLGAVSALVGRSDTVLEDRLNHASLLDAGLLSGARFRRYAHADAGDLAGKLADGRGRQLVVSDGVFSMDGDAAPLTALADTCEAHGAGLMVDDAHGLGVLGEGGGGLVETTGEGSRVPVLVGTLGKAFGTGGAFVAGDEALIETLIQFARTYIYTTALPPAVAAATLKSLDLARGEAWRREHLQTLIRRFREDAAERGYELLPSATPIQPLLVGDDETALHISDRLREQGFLVTAIRPPTVPEGTARLRVTLSAAHEEADVKALLEALDQAHPQAHPG